MIKLFKYEFKQTWRMGVTLLSSTLLGSLGLILNPFSLSSVFSALYITLFVLIVVGSPIALLIYCITSFNQEFAGGQGYLMMTLPIKAKDFIWAKFIVQLLWNMLAVIIVISSLPIIIYRYSGATISMSIIGEANFGQIIANGLSSYSLTIFIIYFSIAVLSIRPRNSHITFMKIALAIVITNVINLLISAISVLLVASPLVLKQGIPMNMYDVIRFSDYLESNMQGLNMVTLTMNLFVAGIFYLLTKNMIENKVQI